MALSPVQPLPVRPRLGSLPLSSPSRMSCREPGESLRSPSGDLCVGGRSARVKGWRWGRAGGGICLGEQLLDGGEGLALNRGPQLGFHNDTSGEQAESSAVQMGKLRRRLLQSLRREGPPISHPGPFIFPRKPLWPRSWSALAAVLRVYETAMEGSGHLAVGTVLLLTHQRDPSPTSAAGRSAPLGRLSALPCSRAWERLIFSTWPLFPAWRELGGQGREEGSQG